MESISFSILFVLGFSIVGGLVGASFFQKLRIPQVLGFIVIGFLVGCNLAFAIGQSIMASHYLAGMPVVCRRRNTMREI